MKSIEKHVAQESSYYNYSASTTAKEGLLYLICTGDFTYEPGYDLYRNSYDSFLIEVFLEGEMSIETDGQTFMVSKDDLVILDCYRPHRYYTNTGCRVLWAHFDGASARTYYNMIQRANGNIFSAAGAGTVYTALHQIFEMFHSGRILNEAQIALLLTKALTGMMMPVNQSKRAQNKSSAIDEVIYYIHEHLSDDLPISELAKLACYSEYHFIRIFESAVGMTPRKYIINVRMDYAKYLLKSTDLPVQEIGFRTGYASESMFCTSFKRQVGVTPSEYRGEKLVAQTP